MKKQLQTLKAIAVFTLASFGLSAQTTADLQNLTLSPSSFYNGSNGTPTVTSVNTFTSGSCVFPNKYNGGGYWQNGWAYSNMKDSTTAGFTNQYSARWAEGYLASTNYAIGRGGSVLKFNATAVGKQMDGFYVTNSTYASISMRDGDSFGKKFGTVLSGTVVTNPTDAPDWFKLKVQKYLGGVLAPDSVTFYLADFRDVNNANDYIVKNWRFVNLKSLGNVDSLKFTLSSSDVGSFGMNTPSYFCIDNFTSLDVANALTTQTINAVNCAGASVNVTFTTTGVYNTGNVFTAQLSDASGSFTSPVSVGTITSTSTSSLTATIPANTTSGTGYKVRVNSSNPAVIGIANSNNITVNACTSINELVSNSDISIYPNPSSNTVYVLSNTELKKVELYNQLGELVLESKFKTIDLSILAKGMYIARIYAVNGTVITKRIIKD